MEGDILTDPNCVNMIYEDKLYLGDVRVFNNVELLKKLAFTHILTVELMPVPMTITSRFPHVALFHVSIYIEICSAGLEKRGIGDLT